MGQKREERGERTRDEKGGTDVERGEGRGSGSCEGGRGTRVVVRVEEWIDRMSA